jgi:hypothetical protein
MGIAMGRMILFGLAAGIYLFYFLLYIFLIVVTAQSSSGVYLASCPVDTGELFFQSCIGQSTKLTSHVRLLPR